MNPTIKNHKKRIIGYKAFKKNEKGLYTDGMGNSNRVYFEIDKEYKTEGKPELCSKGFHFFRYFCFAIDYFEKDNVICKIESLGEVQEDTEKCVTNHIKILNIEYIEDTKIDGYMNSGDMNSGNMNSGDMNSGNMNSGNRNSGNRNSGYRNSGNMNSGYRNSGYMNSGYMNSGDMNSGDMNSGNGNSGYMNSGNGNSGYKNSGDMNSGDMNSGNMNSGNGYRNFFCTSTRYFIFDIECTQEEKNKIYQLKINWFNLQDKTYKEAWKECPKEVLEQIKKLKNFNADKFFEITGLKI